ncbi:MAG TPA: hypothetical protein VLA43_07290, partial [Longimicrobiales bacterium]|nr:hypothetical protein [Longimicrobiales bacterium]
MSFVVRPQPPLTSLARLVLVAALTLAPAAASAQQNDWDPQAVLAAKEWVAPPGSIADAVLAPRYLNASLNQPSPDGAWFVQEVGDGPVTMDRFSLPFDELGGVFIDFQANRHRNLTIRSNVGIKVISAQDGSTVDVQVPGGARVSEATWSPDGSQLAFYVHTADATHIYVADPATGRSRQVTRTPVLATMVTSFQWTADGREIATVLVPENRAPRPQAPRIPTGPQVKQTWEGENMLRTYASLMATPHDEALLEWHATGQLATVNVENRRVTRIGGPAMIWSLDFAPDGAHAMVELLQKPFSYVVPVGSFGRVTEIWDRSGTRLAQVAEQEMQTGVDGNLPTAPGVGGEAQEEDRRQIAWRKDGQGLTFLQMEAAPDSAESGEAPQEGERNGRSGRKDRVMQWVPPFDDASLSLVYENDTRMATHRFSPDYGILFASERQGDRVHEFAVFLDDVETRHTLFRWNTEEFYENPGSLVMVGSLPGGGFGGFGRGDAGATQNVLVSADGEHVFLYGNVYNEDPMEEAPRNFLDRVAIRTGEKERVFSGENEGMYERIAAILDVEDGDFVVSRESPTQVDQFYRVAGGQSVQLTRNVDYTPDLTSAPKRRFVVERPDGFRFLVNVTLPQGYQEGTRLPAMFWFYPREYEDQESYDETARTYNKNAFTSYGT